MNKPLWVQEMWKNIWTRLQEPDANLVFHVPAHKVPTASGNQEADALAKTHALVTDLSVDTADWIHQKSGHQSIQVGWCIAKEEALEFQLKVTALKLAKVLVTKAPKGLAN